MSEGDARNHSVVLCKKSEELRTYSNALLLEAYDLCQYSRELRNVNTILAATNSNPNAARSRDSIGAALRFASRPRVRFSIDIPLHRDEQISNEQRLKVLYQSRVHY